MAMGELILEVKDMNLFIRLIKKNYQMTLYHATFCSGKFIIMTLSLEFKKIRPMVIRI
jgi:hypothetical protein